MQRGVYDVPSAKEAERVLRKQQLLLGGGEDAEESR